MPLDPTKLRARREALNLSQSDVARLASMAQPNYARIESGRRPDPNLSTAEAIAAALRWPVTKLLMP